MDVSVDLSSLSVLSGSRGGLLTLGHFEHVQPPNIFWMKLIPYCSFYICLRGKRSHHHNLLVNLSFYSWPSMDWYWIGRSPVPPSVIHCVSWNWIRARSNIINFREELGWKSALFSGISLCSAIPKCIHDIVANILSSEVICGFSSVTLLSPQVS